jgi:hypothetical protein
LAGNLLGDPPNCPWSIRPRYAPEDRYPSVYVLAGSPIRGTIADALATAPGAGAWTRSSVVVSGCQRFGGSFYVNSTVQKKNPGRWEDAIVTGPRSGTSTPTTAHRSGQAHAGHRRPLHGWIRCAETWRCGHPTIFGCGRTRSALACSGPTVRRQDWANPRRRGRRWYGSRTASPRMDRRTAARPRAIGLTQLDLRFQWAYGTAFARILRARR